MQSESIDLMAFGSHKDTTFLLKRFLTVAIACGLLMGCGDSIDARRIAVNGSVSIGSEPVAEGTLSLVPVGEGPACGVAVKDGLFEIVKEEGPVPGEYTVRLTPALKKSFGQDDTPPPATPQPLKISISEEELPIILDFKIAD